ncbi:MAG: hypothetical protein ACREP9_12415 [Candidatus Dormibacteraceae bacterium]
MILRRDDFRRTWSGCCPGSCGFCYDVGRQLGTFNGVLIFDAALNYTVIPNAISSPGATPTPTRRNRRH